jgi:hypothetical protein
MIGTSDSRRTSLARSRPSPSGSMTSSRIRSGSLRRYASPRIQRSRRRRRRNPPAGGPRQGAPRSPARLRQRGSAVSQIDGTGGFVVLDPWEVPPHDSPQLEGGVSRVRHDEYRQGPQPASPTISRAGSICPSRKGGNPGCDLLGCRRARPGSRSHWGRASRFLVGSGPMDASSRGRWRRRHSVTIRSAARYGHARPARCWLPIRSTGRRNRCFCGLR